MRKSATDGYDVTVCHEQYISVNCLRRAISIGERVALNADVSLNAAIGGQIYIGDNVLVGPRVLMRATDHAFFQMREDHFFSDYQ